MGSPISDNITTAAALDGPFRRRFISLRYFVVLTSAAAKKCYFSALGTYRPPPQRRRASANDVKKSSRIGRCRRFLRIYEFEYR